MITLLSVEASWTVFSSSIVALGLARREERVAGAGTGMKRSGTVMMALPGSGRGMSGWLVGRLKMVAARRAAAARV